MSESLIGPRIDPEADRATMLDDEAVFTPAAAPAPKDLKLTLTIHGGYICDDDPGEDGYKQKQPRGSISDNEARLLSALAYRRNVLEIGTGLGVSTRALAETARHVTTVDPDAWVGENVFPALRIKGVDCRSNTALLPAPFDLVFIDGNHATDSVRADLGLAWSALKDNGFAVLHDARLESVRAALPEGTYVVATEFHMAIVPRSLIK